MNETSKAVKATMTQLNAEFAEKLLTGQEWRGAGVYPCLANVIERNKELDKEDLCTSFYALARAGAF